MGEDSLLERVTAAAEERQLSQNSLIAYRRTWLKMIAWAAAEGLVLETFPVERGVLSGGRLKRLTLLEHVRNWLPRTCLSTTALR
jgi:hypothetical protein